MAAQLDRDKRTRPEDALAPVQGTGEQFLPGAGFAEEQHRRIGGGHLLELDQHTAE